LQAGEAESDPMWRFVESEVYCKTARV